MRDPDHPEHVRLEQAAAAPGGQPGRGRRTAGPSPERTGGRPVAPRSGVSVGATPAALAVLAQATWPASYQDLAGTVLRRPAATPVLAERLVDRLS